jgi:uncharacterized membrane protein
MINLFLYSGEDSEQDRKVRDDILALRGRYEFRFVEINIRKDLSAHQKYVGKTPYIEVGPYHIEKPVTPDAIQTILQSAADRDARLSHDDPGYPKRVQAASITTKGDRLGYWISKNYMKVVILILVIYLGLPFLAPVLQKLGVNSAARLIQSAYKPLCHQLAYRSWFLFGEQPAYPRELAGIKTWITYEQATGLDSRDLLSARAFTGNDLLGYKVAFCERDVAIYAGMLITAILFSLTGRRWKAIPWYAWLILGIIPIGIDGTSQLPSLINLNINWLPIRESTPLLRTITGLLFGSTTALYGLPLIAETMWDSRQQLIKKFALVKVISNEAGK